MIKTHELYDLCHSLAAGYLEKFEYPWQALGGIKALILELGPKLGDDYVQVSPEVWVHKTATVAPTAYLGSPCIIGANTEAEYEFGRDNLKEYPAAFTARIRKLLAGLDRYLAQPNLQEASREDLLKRKARLEGVLNGEVK